MTDQSQQEAVLLGSQVAVFGDTDGTVELVMPHFIAYEIGEHLQKIAELATVGTMLLEVSNEVADAMRAAADD